MVQMNFHDKKKNSVCALKYILKEKFCMVYSFSAWFKYLYRKIKTIGVECAQTEVHNL